jgi:hypothetical protein
MSLPNCLEALRGALEQAKPRTVLALGAPARGLLDALPGAHELTVVEAGPWLSKVDGLGSFDLVLVAGVVEQLPKPEATTLLGRLRDLHTRRLFLLLPLGAQGSAPAGAWQQNDLIALGMERVGECSDGDTPLQLYKFDLLTYKRTPDWFNSKYWAHPELWDKY